MSSLKGIRLSEEHKHKIGDANRGKKRTEEERLRISEGHKGQIPWNKGVPASIETRKKISEANKRRSPESRQKQADALRGRKLLQEHKDKLCIARSKRAIEPMLGKKHSKETKHKISQALKGKPKSPEHNQKVAEASRGKKLSKEHRLSCSLAQSKLRAEGKFLTKDRYKKGYHNGLHYDSGYELKFMQNLDKQGIAYKRCPFQIRYELDDCIRHYNPDFLIDATIVEVKPLYMLDDKRNVAKFAAAKRFASDMNLMFKVITENELEQLFTVRTEY